MKKGEVWHIVDQQQNTSMSAAQRCIHGMEQFQTIIEGDQEY